MVDRIARCISFISNPLFLLIPVPYLLIYKATGDSETSLKWLFFSLIFLFSIGIFVLVGVRKGIFTDFDVSNRQQRPLLFIITGLIILVFFFSVYFFNGPKVLYVACFGILMGVFILSVINTKIKASLHVATATVFFLTIGILYAIPPVYYVFLPIIAWSRIRIKRHTLSETIAGFFSAVFIVGFLYSVLKFIYHIDI